jgi:hypothetical protein
VRRKCRKEVTQQLSEGRFEIPDIIAMPLCSSFPGDSRAAQRAAASMPPHARALVAAATVNSEPPLRMDLPHAAAIARLKAAKKPVPDVRPMRPRGPTCSFHR